jgi:hypothetical protein
LVGSRLDEVIAVGPRWVRYQHLAETVMAKTVFVDVAC